MSDIVLRLTLDTTVLEGMLPHLERAVAEELLSHDEAEQVIVEVMQESIGFEEVKQ